VLLHRTSIGTFEATVLTKDAKATRRSSKKVNIYPTTVQDNGPGTFEDMKETPVQLLGYHDVTFGIMEAHAACVPLLEQLSKEAYLADIKDVTYDTRTGSLGMRVVSPNGESNHWNLACAHPYMAQKMALWLEVGSKATCILTHLYAGELHLQIQAMGRVRNLWVTTAIPR
jgi:hypothetical protein